MSNNIIIDIEVLERKLFNACREYVYGGDSYYVDLWHSVECFYYNGLITEDQFEELKSFNITLSDMFFADEVDEL